MLWLAFLGIHLAGYVGYNLLLRHSLLTKQVDGWTLATVMQTGIALPMVPLIIFSPPDLAQFSGQSWLLVGVIVSLIILLHVANVKALQYLEASVYSILFSLRIVITTVLGIVFLGEEVIPLQILGGLLIFTAIATVKQSGNRTLTIRGIQWGVASALIISVLQMFEKTLIGDVGYLQYAAPVMLLTAAVMWTVSIARHKRLRLEFLREPRMWSLMGFRAASAYGGTLPFAYGGKLSVVNYISSLSLVLLVICGAIFLKERDYLGRKALASALAAVGLALILAAQ